jgi:hypothetical protein
MTRWRAATAADRQRNKASPTHADCGASRHTLPMDVLNNGEVGNYRTEKNAPEQKKKQVSKQKKCRPDRSFFGNSFALCAIPACYGIVTFITSSCTIVYDTKWAQENVNNFEKVFSCGHKNFAPKAAAACFLSKLRTQKPRMSPRRRGDFSDFLPRGRELGAQNLAAGDWHFR